MPIKEKTMRRLLPLPIFAYCFGGQFMRTRQWINVLSARQQFSFYAGVTLITVALLLAYASVFYFLYRTLPKEQLKKCRRDAIFVQIGIVVLYVFTLFI